MAYHEAGHAVCGWFLEHADPLLKVCLIILKQYCCCQNTVPEKLAALVFWINCKRGYDFFLAVYTSMSRKKFMYIQKHMPKK